VSDTACVWFATKCQPSCLSSCSYTYCTRQSTGSCFTTCQYAHLTQGSCPELASDQVLDCHA
jgi:hypothetical protein